MVDLRGKPHAIRREPPRTGRVPFEPIDPIPTPGPLLKPGPCAPTTLGARKKGFCVASRGGGSGSICAPSERKFCETSISRPGLVRKEGHGKSTKGKPPSSPRTPRGEGIRTHSHPRCSLSPRWLNSSCLSQWHTGTGIAAGAWNCPGTKKFVRRRLRGRDGSRRTGQKMPRPRGKRRRTGMILGLAEKHWGFAQGTSSPSLAPTPRVMPDSRSTYAIVTQRQARLVPCVSTESGSQE